jgi:hypothetical protein
MNKVLVILFLSLVGSICQGQSMADREKNIAYHCDVMMNAAEGRHRWMAHEVFYKEFSNLIHEPQSFNYPFDSLKWISKKYPEDKSFRIITWEVKPEKGDTKYFGFVQKADGSVFELTDQFKQADGLEEEVSHEAWYGSIYYHIMDMKDAKGQTCYLLFGQNKWSNLEHKKIIDVLFFSSSGKPYFGKKVFKIAENGEVDVMHHRLVFTYASDARMTLNYNPGLELIVHDNLIPKLSRVEMEARTLVPDGSYVGWQYVNGYWVMIDKLATQAMETAPRPTPVLDERQGKNIMGKSKKN